MKVALHPAAEADVAEAAAFYEQEASAVVAARFVAEFKRVAMLVVQQPGIGAPRTGGRRLFHFKVFPYGLIYRQIPDGIHVLVVRHDRRRPGFGMRRK